MDEKEKFKIMLYGSILESTTSLETVKQVNGSLRKWVRNNIPNSLYRYRNFCDYSINAFENDEIWGSSIITFNDPYECVPCYDLQRLEQEIHDGMVPERIIEKFKQFKESNQQESIFDIFDETHKERLKEVNPKNMDIEQMRVVLAAFESFLMQYLDKNYSKIANDYFLAVCAEEAKRLIACFSEDKVSNLMWSHYADSHKGFCIEYNLSDLIQGCECNCDNPRFCMNMMMNTPVAPVIYADSRYDASVTLVNSIVQYLSEMSGVKMKPLYEDYLFILKCLLTKSIEWNYEREWRLFSVNREIKEHGVICKHVPTAVYIGSKMPNVDAEVLYGICQDKKIECYKMIMNYMGMDYGIQPMKYEEYRKIALKG